MTKISSDNKKVLKELNARLKVLQEELVQANKLEGKDVYIGVKTKKNQARYEKVAQKEGKDIVKGKFFLEIEIIAKQGEVFIPLSIASGKKVAGFMYQIEGTAPGSILTADIEVRGEGVSQVTVGTLLYAKIPMGKTASFQIRASIRGAQSKAYKIVIVRLNYKLHLTDTRYQQYLKEIHSESVTLS